MIYLKTSVGIEIRGEDLLIASLQRNLSAGVFTSFTRIADFRLRDRKEVRREVDAFFRSRRLSRDNVVLGLPRRDIIIRHLELPAEVAENLKQVIQYQVQSFEPTEEEKFYYDFAPVRAPKNGKRLHILLVMVRKSFLDGQLDILRDLGLRPAVVTGGTMALANLFLKSRKEAEKKTYFLADLAETGIDLMALREGALLYARESPRREEESWKKLLLEQIDLATARAGLEPEDSVDQIVLSGEASEAALQEIQSEIPDCECIERSVRFEMPPEMQGKLRQAAASLGLAYTGMARRTPVKLNLLPAELRVRQTRWAYVPTIILALAAIGLLAAFAFRQMAQERMLISRLDQEILALKPAVDRVQVIRTQTETLEKKIVVVEGLLRQRYMNLEVLQELTTALPSDTFLTVYRNKEGAIEVSGSGANVHNLIPPLEKSPLLKEVALRGTVFKDVQTGKDRFNIEAKLERQP
jgi:Tfp pilus assembly PilM family ATPase/Tfp pilus assembly protein PilN